MRKTILSFGFAFLLLGALAWTPPVAHARGRNNDVNAQNDGGSSIHERLLNREGEDADDGDGRHGRVENNDNDDDDDGGGGGRRGRVQDDDGDDDDGGGRAKGRRNRDDD